MRSNYYVYELAYPESMGSAVFYVGMGWRGRINDHEYNTRRGLQLPVCLVIREIWKHGEEVVKRKILEDLSKHEAREQERRRIEFHGLSNLVNRLPGRQTRVPNYMYRYQDNVFEVQIRSGVQAARPTFR